MSFLDGDTFQAIAEYEEIEEVIENIVSGKYCMKSVLEKLSSKIVKILISRKAWANFFNVQDTKHRG